MSLLRRSHHKNPNSPGFQAVSGLNTWRLQEGDAPPSTATEDPALMTPHPRPHPVCVFIQLSPVSFATPFPKRAWGEMPKSKFKEFNPFPEEEKNIILFEGILFEQSFQFSSVAQSCPTLCNPMNCSMPGLPVHHQLPEFTQTHFHRVSDAIQPSHPLSSPSPPAPNPSQHQSLFQFSQKVKIF